jgi:hypothetical protein
MTEHMANPKGNPSTLTAPRFKPGQSGNIAGNPQSLRQKLQFDFTKALQADFEKHGHPAIELARESDPLGYVKMVASLMPKQFEQTQPLDDLTDEQINAGIALLRTGLVKSPGTGTGEATEPTTIN